MRLEDSRTWSTMLLRTGRVVCHTKGKHSRENCMLQMDVCGNRKKYNDNRSKNGSRVV